MNKLNEYVDNNLEIGGINSDFNSPERFYKWINIQCPCGSSRLWGAKAECDSKGNLLSKEWDVGILTNNLLNHIEHQIRLNACVGHINILSNFIGEEQVLIKLERYAQKNMIVALALKSHIKKLKRVRLEEEQE